MLQPVATLDAGEILKGAITQIQGIFETVAPVALGVGAAIFALMFGWVLVRRFVS